MLYQAILLTLTAGDLAQRLHRSQDLAPRERAFAFSDLLNLAQATRRQEWTWSRGELRREDVDVLLTATEGKVPGVIAQATDVVGRVRATMYKNAGCTGEEIMSESDPSLVIPGGCGNLEQTLVEMIMNDDELEEHKGLATGLLPVADGECHSMHDVMMPAYHAMFLEYEVKISRDQIRKMLVRIMEHGKDLRRFVRRLDWDYESMTDEEFERAMDFMGLHDTAKQLTEIVDAEGNPMPLGRVLHMSMHLQCAEFPADSVVDGMHTMPF